MLRRLIFASLAVLLTTTPAMAISTSDDLLIAGAARTSRWVADLYINNPGATTVQVEVFWLERDQPNPNPDSRTFAIGAEETLILPDVIRNNFNMNRGEGAFRITATGGEVSANLIAVSGTGSETGSLGSGFEAIPAAAATSAGEVTFVMGLAADADFYTNLFALAGADGVTMDLDLLSASGTVLDSATVTLGAYQPWLSFRTDIWSTTTFEGTLRASVSSGSAVILGSKIDEISADPTTLESQFGAGAGTADGTYQFAVYDSLAFAAGGNMIIDDNVVEVLNGTYYNFDKVDGGGTSECTLIFLWGIGLGQTAVDDFASGVEFTDTYPDGGSMTWTVTFELEDNTGFQGTVDAVGSNFTGEDTGCNGSFPTLTFNGGKID
jgi:hypothetical protein